MKQAPKGTFKIIIFFSRKEGYESKQITYIDEENIYDSLFTANGGMLRIQTDPS